MWVIVDKAWIDKKYPNGDIAWKHEYARLLGTLEQALPAIDGSKTVKSVCQTAVAVGKILLEVEIKS
jgi:hypothetical protein